MPVSTQSLAEALSRWRQVVGHEHVCADEDVVRAASTATFPTRSIVQAILRPGTREEVQSCVAIANQTGVQLYPVSTGRNWGYGSRAPVSDGVVLDLARLNRILDFNEQLAYVTVEPGVTQRQLYEFLRGQSSALWMDATGSSPDCSIIGNTVERGFGHTPMGDHCSHAYGFEVVLPTGEVAETGLRRFRGARAAGLSRWGTGPALDGLFTQSNLGIVTAMTVWLMPAPEYFQAVIFQADRPVGPIVEALRPLRLNGTLRSVMHIGNDYKILSGSSQYPWHETGGATPLSLQKMAELRQKLRITQWSGSGGLYGTKAQVREARRLLRRALKPSVDRLQFIDERLLATLGRLEPTYRALTRRTDLGRALKILPPLFDVLRGIPTDGFLASAYWRKKTPPPDVIDIDRDRCGLLWSSPAAPCTGADVEHVCRIAVGESLKHGFEPIISVSLINERLTISTIALTYDRDVPGEDSRAVACYRDLTAALLAAGYPPYRLNVSSMEFGRQEGGYGKVVERLKRALDPNDILAPGRYDQRVPDVGT
jgi:4-cresol dehydrogenase (hydroxylating)